jgi:hypothetical protein
MQQATSSPESGSVLLALVAAVLPLAVMVVASTTTMATRNKGLQYDIMQTKALLAAEAGIDEAIFRAANGNLHHGVAFSRTLPSGQSFTVEPTHLQSDGKDNDGDSLIDESDENVFELIVTGTYRNAKRRLAAYLGPVGNLPKTDAAITVTDDDVDIDLDKEDGHDPLLTGKDTNMDGTLAGGEKAGLAIESPGTLADLLGELNSYEKTRVQGLGSTPTTPSLLVVSNGYDFDAIEDQARNSANIVLKKHSYKNVNWGNAETGSFNIIYRKGSLEVRGGRGAGLLVVSGKIELEDGFRWDGLIISTDGNKLQLKSDDHDGKVEVYGAILVSPKCRDLEMEGDVAVYYSSQVIGQLNTLVPISRYIGFNGWQEISIY